MQSGLSTITLQTTQDDWNLPGTQDSALLLTVPSLLSSVTHHSKSTVETTDQGLMMRNQGSQRQGEIHGESKHRQGH